MSARTREMRIQALLDLLQPALTAAGLVGSISRRLKHWGDVPGESQPAAFLTQGQELPEQRVEGFPAKWRLELFLRIYVFEPDDTASPAARLNPFLDAVDTVLRPPMPGGKQTLGGLVDHCWIGGAIETFEGFLGPQEVALIPIHLIYAS